MMSNDSVSGNKVGTESITTEKVSQLFEKANNSFLNKKNHSLFEKKVCERTLCGALMLELYNLIRCDNCFQGYYVDLEYNRNDKAKKVVCEFGQEDEQNLSNGIFCDLLVHSRGEKELDNLLCVEMKIFKNEQSVINAINKDLKRLYGLTTANCGESSCGRVCGYMLGVSYIVDESRENVFIKFLKPHEKEDVPKKIPAVLKKTDLRTFSDMGYERKAGNECFSCIHDE